MDEWAETRDASAERSAAPATKGPSEHRLEFTGTGADYFRIWIVNLCLTVLTLYVYAPWAKVRAERWFAAHTVLDGTAADYHARPRQLFLGSWIGFALLLFLSFGDLLGETMLWAVVLAPYTLLPLLGAWAAARSRAFRAAMTSWRGVRFGFSGTPGAFLRYRVVWPMWLGLLAGASLGLADALAGPSPARFWGIVGGTCLAAIALVPVPRARLARYVASRYRFGDSRFESSVGVGAVYLIHLRALGSGLLWAAGLWALVEAAVRLRWGVSASAGAIGIAHEVAEIGFGAPDPRIAWAMLAGLALALAAIPGGAALAALMREHVFARTRSPDLALRSTVRPAGLVWLGLSNALLLVATAFLAWPWVRVRRARFFLEGTRVIERRPLAALVERRREAAAGGVGDEIGDVIDVDAGFGF